MKTASGWLIIDRTGSNVQKHDLTPAEVQLLCVMHMPVIGKFPISDLKETADVKRTDAEEVARLSMKYGKTRVEGLFGKVNPKLPADFKSALTVPGDHQPAEESEAKVEPKK